MTIFDYTILGACGIGFAAVIGYAFWIKARVLGLKANILTILTNLEKRAAELGISDDEALRFARKKLIGLMEVADSFSFSTLVYTVSCESSEKEKAVEPWSQSTDPKLQMAIDYARKSASRQLAQYITSQTLAGILVGLLMKALPRSVRKKDVEAVAEASMGRLPAIRRDLHTASC